eukprot:scaffold104587_cov44-Cyclotella_meneghiniana.AAC.3
MLSKVGDLETKVSNFERSLNNLQNLIEANTMLTNAIKNARDREVRLEAELKKSKRKIDEVMKTVAMTSPAGASVIGAGAGTPRSTTDADGNAALDMDGEVSAENEGKTAEEDLDDALLPEDEVQEPPSQQQRVVNAFEMLDGLPTAPLIDPKELSIGLELERLYKSNIFAEKKRMADEESKSVPKRALFDCGCHYFFGLNPVMVNDGHGGRQANIDAMTLAAIAFNNEQWNEMFTELDDAALRKICSEVNQQAHDWLKKKAIDICQKDPKSTRFRKLKNLRSFSGKYKEIMQALDTIWHKSDLEVAEWLKNELGEVASRTQLSLTAAGFVSRPRQSQSQSNKK